MFELIKNGKPVPILVEDTAFLGVYKIAEKAAKDIESIGGQLPQIYTNLEEIKDTDKVILYATIGKSDYLNELEQKNLINLEEIKGKREVFGIRLIEEPWEGIKQALVIYGSDKRGTIYGIFRLSEILGISPLLYWADGKPEKKTQVTLDKSVEITSKEPSVKYRGFFINDEWPCFGNWTVEHFGGFTADMYDHVFELLLRLNGNYLWPAMWTSSFALDGPGLANAELADLYGVIMGNSHHEPCLRASEEWDILRGADSIYGNEWNYYTNKDGLLRYWEDGLKRSGNYEGVITIGMRGERDSSMLGPDATLRENIDLLKDIITEQRKLIQKHVNEDVEAVPQLLALYKEVESYFYGDAQTEGLKDWEGLDGVSLMLCEDNQGNMRTLPTEEMRGHKGGYGMYYHFDYHGDPISYEWVNSTPLSKIWEQMTMAYEYGVRNVWVVNVGDLKFNEFPLSYFMSLAYDFEAWGTEKPNQTERFTRQWMNNQFGGRITKEQVEKLVQVQTGYVRINGRRRPEALNSGIYHTVHYREADRVIAEAQHILMLAEELLETIPEDCKASYYSSIYFPAAASMNILLMHLYTGKNEHYAKQGRTIANTYADLVTECIQKDKRLAEEFGKALGGKWNGMQLAQHIGFTKWNEDNCRYPLRMQVEPAYKPRMVISRADDSYIGVKDYFAPMVIEVKDFLYQPNDKVEIEVANDGIGSFTYRVEMEPCEWLSFERNTEEVKVYEVLTLVCHRSKLPKETDMRIIMLDDGDTKVAIHVYGKAVEEANLPPMTFLENQSTVVMEANHYQSLTDTKDGKLILLEEFGRSGYGLKAFPLTKDFEAGKGPKATYTFSLEEAGAYVAEVWMAPSNPMRHGAGMCYGIRINGEEMQVVDSISKGFEAGVPHNPGWEEGVLNNVRVSKNPVTLKEGINTATIEMIDPGFVLERLVIYKVDSPLKKSYLGPKESYFVK